MQVRRRPISFCTLVKHLTESKIPTSSLDRCKIEHSDLKHEFRNHPATCNLVAFSVSSLRGTSTLSHIMWGSRSERGGHRNVTVVFSSAVTLLGNPSLM